MFKSLKRILFIGIVLFLVLILTIVIGSFRFEVDLAQLAWASAAIMALYIIGALVSYYRQPKRIIHVNTKVEFSSPPRLLKSVRNYKLKLVVSKSYEEKGTQREVVMDELLLSFNDSDHPNVYAYCMNLIGQQVERSINQVQLSYPKAEVVASPLVLPPGIQKLEP